jgi:CRISPR/Cas system CSM-associated protein Csm3 (group 7 of RAMP superfamily)
LIQIVLALKDRNPMRNAEYSRNWIGLPETSETVKPQKKREESCFVSEDRPQNSQKDSARKKAVIRLEEEAENPILRVMTYSRNSKAEEL